VCCVCQFVGRRALVVIATGMVAGCVALGAQASSGGTLRLLGGRPGTPGTSCGVTPHWTYFHLGGIARYAGHVTAPVTSVNIVIWRCRTTRFKIVETLSAAVGPSGAFKGSFAVNVHSDCFAQASYPGGHSNRAYFRVR
jgi:hypothetical protein